MDRAEERFDRIENYLRGKMLPAEKTVFEQQIAADPDLREEVEMHRFEQDALELLVEDKLRTNLKKWQHEPPPPPPAEQSGNGRMWLLAAVLGIAAIAFWMLLPTPPKSVSNPNKPATNQNDTIKTITLDTTSTPPVVIKEDSKSEEVTTNAPDYITMATELHDLPTDLEPSNLKGTTTSETTSLTLGSKAFEAADYKKAVVELRKITPTDDEGIYLQAQRMLGHSYFLTKDYKNAAAVFEQLAFQTDSELTKSEGEWYLTLSLLTDYPKNKKRINALLAKITNPANEHDYRAQAEKLQNQLRSTN